MSHKVRVLLFGLLRKYSDSHVIELTVPEGSGLDTLREVLSEKILERHTEFPEGECLENCAFGNETEVLGPDFVVTRDVEVAVLPPVCGG